MSIIDRTMSKNASAASANARDMTSLPGPRVTSSGAGISTEQRTLRFNRPGADHSIVLESTGDRQLTAQIRALKRQVLDSVRRRCSTAQASVVMITSAVPGDGKSFISLNLAIALSKEPDTEVILIDGDLARQKISSDFGAVAESGLTACLIQETVLTAAIHRTEVPKLSLVPAGRRRPSAAECLASSRWDSLIAEMRGYGNSHLIVIDTPPILAASETEYLLHTADLVLFVVRAEVTPRQAVIDALARIGDLSRIAFVFNGHVKSAIDAYYDYSDYGAE